MKKSVILLTIVVILPIFGLKIHAEDEFDRYVNDAWEIMPDELKDSGDAAEGLLDALDPRSLILFVSDLFSENGGRWGRFLLTLLGVAMLISLSSLCHDRLASQVESAVGIISSVVVFSAIGPVFLAVQEGICELGRFFGSLIPITVGISALGGATVSASVQASGMYATLSLISVVGGSVLSVISTLGMAMGLLGALGNESVASVIKGVKGIFGRIVGIATAMVTAAFALQTLIATSADTASLRAAKYAASGLIPVVGSTVSGALSTLAAGLAYAKGIVGGGAIAAIVYLAVSPLFLLLLYRLSLSLVMILSDFCGSSVASRIFSSYRDTLDMTICIYALSALIYLFEIIIFIRMGTSFI